MKSVLFSPAINKKDRHANFLIKRFSALSFFTCARVTLNRKSVWHVLINCKCLRSTYFFFIHIYINYANIAWASTNKTKLKKLFGKQKQAVRIILNQDRLTHSRPFFKTLNALNVCQIICCKYICSCTRWNWTHPLESCYSILKQ